MNEAHPFEESEESTEKGILQRGNDFLKKGTNFRFQKSPFSTKKSREKM